MTIPGPHAIVVLVIALVAFYLYTRPRIRMELVALLLLVALVLTFYLFPLHEGQIHISDVDVLSGFGHPVLIAILCLMILGRGMLMTGALEPVVWNRFRRMTLADFERQERITIDMALEFGRGEQAIAMPGLAIVEIKQRKFSLNSPMARELHRLQLHPTHVSKFCVSMAMLYPELKHNRFKPILRRLSAITEG